MLTNLQIGHFKAFKQLPNLRLKPITILCGTNSCGKSSLLQSLLLMKQTFENRTPNQNLLLNGRFVKLGYLQDVIYQKQPHTSVELGFTYRVNEQGNPFVEEFLIQLLTRFNPKFAFQFRECYFDFRVAIKPDTSTSGNTAHYLGSGIVDKLKLTVYVREALGSKQLIGIELVREEKATYTLKCVVEGQDFIAENRLTVKFENLIPNTIFSDNSTQKDRIQLVKKSFNEVYDILQEIFAQYSYIGPLRQSHKDGGGFYFGDDISEIGNWGENAPYLYLKEQNKELNHHFFYHPLTNSFAPQNNLTLWQALDQWLTQMGVAGFSGKISNRIINLQLQAGKFDHTSIDISQVGFGVSQMFPVLLEGLRMEKGETLLLEQPEIHLHPNLQMQMADFFIAMALSGKHIMAETHSDHLVNRLVRRIIADTTHNLSNLIAIYFVKPTPDGAVCEEIVIDPQKGITNWPTDFFTQHATESLQIVQAGIQKRKNAPIIE